MPKSIYLTDEQYQQICEAARKCGYRVQRGRGSQLALFVVAAANTASTPTSGDSPASEVSPTGEVIPSNQFEPVPPTCG